MLKFAPFSADSRHTLMANIKSARKRAHQAVERRAHNMSLRTEVRTAIKNVKKAVAAGNKDGAAKVLLAVPARHRPHRGERHPAPQRRQPSQEPAGARAQGA